MGSLLLRERCLVPCLLAVFQPLLLPSSICYIGNSLSLIAGIWYRLLLHSEGNGIQAHGRGRHQQSREGQSGCLLMSVRRNTDGD